MCARTCRLASSHQPQGRSSGAGPRPSAHAIKARSSHLSASVAVSRGRAASTSAIGQSAGVEPNPRSTRWISTSRHLRNGSIDTACSPPPTVRTDFSHTSSGIVEKSESSRSAVELTSATISRAVLAAPASISAARPSNPPTYCSMISSRNAALIRRLMPSAFRATWVSTWPTVQSGSSDAEATCSSVRPAIDVRSLMCAWRQPSTSLRGALTGASYDTLTVVPADPPTRTYPRALLSLQTVRDRHVRSGGGSSEDQPAAA